MPQEKLPINYENRLKMGFQFLTLCKRIKNNNIIILIQLT